MFSIKNSLIRSFEQNLAIPVPAPFHNPTMTVSTIAILPMSGRDTMSRKIDWLVESCAHRGSEMLILRKDDKNNACSSLSDGRSANAAHPVGIASGCLDSEFSGLVRPFREYVDSNCIRNLHSWKD